MNAMNNRVQLIGNVGNDPEIKNLEGGKKIATISIATKDVYRDANGERQENTQWHKVTAWGNVAEIVEKYVTKGKQVAIEGKLSYRNYEDKNGVKQYVTEITANEIQLFGK